MKHTTQVLLVAALIFISKNSIANEIKTPGAALTKCKAEAELVHPDQTKIVLKKIKQIRSKFKVYLNVSTTKGKIKTLCEITKDGEITYSMR